MWIASLGWLVVALVVCWAIGAYKRLQRLQATIKQVFYDVEKPFIERIAFLRDCARVQSLKERISGSAYPHHVLLSCADLLETCLAQAASRPLQPQTIAALDVAWQSAQTQWLAYVHHFLAQANVQDAQAFLLWCERWLNLCSLHDHSTAQFNTAVHRYNCAIAQFPAHLVARFRGFKPARPFQKNAALQMQPPVLVHDT